jgi:hypothetical protein
MTEAFRASCPPIASYGGPADQVPRAAAEREPPRPPGVGEGAQSPVERADQERHQDVFPEAFRFDPRQNPQKIRAPSLEEAHRLPQARRLIADVRVGEQQDLAAGRARAKPEGMGLADPARRRFASGNDAQPRSARASLSRMAARAVRRTVVDDDDLEVRIVLGELRRDGRRDRPLLVARRDDDRDFGKVRRLRPRARGAASRRG